MRAYELAIIIRPTVDDTRVAEVVEKVKQDVQSFNGQVTAEKMWGRRGLAYPIEKHREGIYVLFELNMPPDSLTQFEQNLKLSEEIIRYMLVKI
ncbi:MAG: 30S ribosomal protein S6 [Chloroflexi bacterium]|nr:MAG: 30S ribosomal protein S6 [Chloroflexota bacterium]